jgi:hypothetical protein
MSEISNKSSTLEELKRLKAKHAASEDRDIKQALQLRIEALTALVEKLDADETAKKLTEASAEALPAQPLEPATPAQLRKADDLIRQARVEKMRKNQSRVTALMKEAAEIAPTSPSVLEALGDDYTERRQYKDALAVYSRAVQLSKNNVELERKHANATLRAQNLSSFEGALRGDDPIFLTSSDSMASLGGARILNAFLPGLGHIVVGKTVTGIVLMATMLGCVIWVAIMDKSLFALIAMVKGAQSQPNLVILIPLFGIVVTYIVGLTSLGAQPTLKQNRSAPRPQPPIDLPFE